MSDISKELLLFLGIALIIVVNVILGRFEKKKNNDETNGFKKDGDDPELRSIKSKKNEGNTNKIAR
jgi:hypothetical protein